MYTRTGSANMPLHGGHVPAWLAMSLLRYFAQDLHVSRAHRSLCFRAEFASHQFLHRLTHRLVLVHNAKDFAANGHFHG
jgi:hypothetical protein